MKSYLFIQKHLKLKIYKISTIYTLNVKELRSVETEYPKVKT